MKFIAKSVFTGLFIMLFSTVAFGQQMQMPPQQPQLLDSVTTEQFNTFVQINKDLQVVQTEAQDSIATILEDQPMTVDRFNQIVMGMQNQQTAGQVNMTNEEQQILTAIQPQLMQLNQTMQQRQSQIIQEGGMTPQMFQRVGMTISQDQELLQKFQAEMMNANAGAGQ